MCVPPWWMPVMGKTVPSAFGSMPGSVWNRLPMWPSTRCWNSPRDAIRFNRVGPDVSKSLYDYYESELLFIRELAKEFAREHPAAAGRLLLEPNRSADPHVERLIESLALLTGRIQHKLADEFPELTDALLGVLYPHYLAPIPSMAIVQFDPDPVRLESPDGFRIERHSILRTPPLDGLRCQYRTGYPVTLWPIAVTEARLLLPPFPPGYQPPPRTKAALRLQLECTGPQSLPALNLNRLRLHLFGEDPVIAGLYELLFNHGNADPRNDTTLQVVFRSLDPGTNNVPIVRAPRDCLHEVGFGTEEGLLPYPRQSFLGYRLLTEYFAFPSKFLFLDLGGFDQVRQA